MGLFRRRRQKHSMAAPEVVIADAAPAEVVMADAAPAEVVMADAAPAEVVMADAGAAEDTAEVPRREVAAERRPDPDRPGWGRTIGQEIGRARHSNPGED